MQSTAPQQGSTTRVSGLLASLNLIAKASSQLLHSSAEPERILPAVLEIAQSLIAADAYAVWISDDSGIWHIVASSGLSERYRNSTLSVGKPPRNPRPIEQTVAIPDIHASELLKDRVQVHTQEGVRSLLISPLFSGDIVSGTLAFYFRSPHESSEDEIHVATALANLTSSALAFSQLHQEQQRNLKHTEFLAEASAVLASSMDYEVTLASVTQLAAPRFADWCAIDLYQDGELQRVGVAHSDPAKVNLACEYRRLYPASMDSPDGVGAVIRTGKKQFWPHVTEEMLIANSIDAQHLAMLRALGLQSFLIMPLRVRDRILGALTLVTSSRDLDNKDVRLAEDLCSRAAVAIENARLFGALEQSERKFRTMASTVPCAIYIHDGRQLLYVNDAAQDLSGYTASELAEIGLFDLVHPADKETVERRAVARWKGEDVPGRYEFRAVRKDGSIRWLDFSGALIDFAGRPALLATAFDITERKFAEQQLERSEREARSLLENLPDIIVRYGPDLRYEYVSPSVERMLGVPASSFIGKSHAECGLPPHLCELFDGTLRRIFASATSETLEFEFITPRGDVRYLAGPGIPILGNDGKVEHVLTITHDLTMFRKAEETVARNEKELRLLTDILPALVAYVDAEERLQRVNQTFEEWFGRPKSELVGRTLREILTSNYPHVESHVKRVLRGELVQYEATNDYADKRRHVLITYVPDFDAEQRVRGFASLIQDITERRFAEEALRKTEKLAAVGRLAASISHEINNPLESVTNLVFLAKNAPELSERTRSYLATAEREIARVSQIATQTLRFYRQSTKPALIDLRETIDSVLSLYEGRITNSQLEVQCEYQNRPCHVQAFEGELRQVIANLLGNAIDATPPGGRIRLRITPLQSLAEPAVRLTIADTGSGIDPALRARIFEPFFTTKTTTGTGLGLWITREILAKHRGRIRVRSRQGPRHGTVFTIVLPKNFLEVAQRTA